MYYIQNPLSNRDAALDEIARRYGYEYQRRKYVETYPYINSVYGSNDIRIRELVERYGVNGAPYIPNPKTISIGNITSNGIVLPQDLNSGIARLSAVRGKSLVWNQLCQFTSTPTITNATWLNNTLLATAKNGQVYWRAPIKSIIVGHKYIQIATLKTTAAAGQIRAFSLGEIINIYNVTTSDSYQVLAGIGTATDISTVIAIRDTRSSGWDTIEVAGVMLIDLTLMFGAGNEPATVEEFEAMYPLSYYDYNLGTIINNNASAIESIGFNQWDEEWESGGINSNTGNVDSSYTDYIHSSNFIPCDNLESYYVKRPLDSEHLNGYIYFYDDSTYLGSSSRVSIYNTSGKEFSIPANAVYMKFAIQYSTYNHDICINISNPSLNGTYKPYKKDTLTLNLSTIKGKLNGEGESVTIFPDGMKSAGTAYDYIIVDADGYARKAVKVMESVDLGTLRWTYRSADVYRSFDASLPSYTKKLVSADVIGNFICPKYKPATSNNATIYTTTNDGIIWIGVLGRDYNPQGIQIRDTTYSDAVTFKAAMYGVELIYELATPQEYVLDEPIYTFFEVEKGGILRAEYNDSEQVHAPLDVDLIYSEAK